MGDEWNTSGSRGNYTGGWWVPSPQPTGWVCPRCGKVWAPHVDQCRDCSSGYYPSPYPPYYPYNPWWTSGSSWVGGAENPDQGNQVSVSGDEGDTYCSSVCHGYYRDTDFLSDFVADRCAKTDMMKGKDCSGPCCDEEAMDDFRVEID